MIDITLYLFDKKVNSTAIPPASAPHESLVGQLVGPFTPQYLTVRFDLGAIDSTEPRYNYARVGIFSRYYFVRWAYVDGAWCATLSVDVLASYRTQILNSTQYVMRSASDADDTIIDTAYLTTGESTMEFSQLSYSDFYGPGVGMVVIGTISDSGHNVGAVTYYAMTEFAFNQLMTDMLSSIDWAGISATEISKELQKALINPVQYIVSAIWLPVNASVYINSSNLQTSTVRLGWWSFNLGQTAAIIDTSATKLRNIYATMRVPKHPQAQSRGKYLNLSPYTTYTLYLYPFGALEIDSTQLLASDTIKLDITLDLLTGSAVLNVRNNYSNASTKPILATRANLGIQMPTGQIAANLANFDNAITMAGVTAAGPVVDAMLGALNSSNPKPMGHGGGGQTAPGLGGGRR
jgi:hypothetical protein